MAQQFRKFRVGFISLGAVFLVYLIYNHISETPPIIIERPQAESNEPQVEFESQIGKVGEVGVGTVSVAEFVTLNKRKQVERKWGFEKLLHDTGDEWDLEKPYMTVFRDDLTCYITADKGRVQVEATGTLKPNTKDATLSDNVVIRIEPENSAKVPRSNIYLDEVTYISELAMFLTDGPVKVVSENAILWGKGMKLVYNEQLDRLESLTIVNLEKLQMKRPVEKAREPGRGSSPAGADKTSGATAAKSAPRKQPQGQQQQEQYRCLLRGNVVVETPEHLIYADKLIINNINTVDADAEEENNQVKPKKTGKTEQADKTDDTIKQKTSQQPSLQEQRGETRQSETGQYVDIVVTCNGGIFISPMDSEKIYGDYAGDPCEPGFAGGKDIDIFADTAGRSVLAAERIDYFLIDETVLLEGNALCSAVSRTDSIDEKYFISAPKLEAKLFEESSEEDDQSAVPGIERMTGGGGTAQLAMAKTANEKLLGFTKLKCLAFEYDRDSQLFTASGPGLIAVDNSKGQEPEEPVSKFDLKRPCYAFVRNFEHLEYSLKTDKITADADDEVVLIDYIPIVQGQYGQQVKAAANYIQADLVETEDGRSEVSQLIATGSVTYEELDMQFAGSDLFYDRLKQTVKVRGNDRQNCYFNGVIVDSIDYDLVTGRVDTKMVGPGAVQLK